MGWTPSLVMSQIKNLHMQYIEFISAFLKLPIKTDIYIKPSKLPTEFEIPDLPNFTDHYIYVYKLINNLYGLKDAIKTWYEYLKHGLLKRGWSQLSIYECIFTKNGVILVIYVDDSILISPSKQNINEKRTSLMKDYSLTKIE